MHKHFIIKFCFLAITALSFSQEDTSSRFGYGMGFGVGSSTLENNQLGVLNGNLLSMRFNVDYRLGSKETTKIVSGIEFLDFTSHFYNGINQGKLKNEYAQIPLRLTHRKGIDKDDKLNFVVGAGVYANLLLRSNITSLEGASNTKSGGVNFGHNLLFGTEYNISSNTSIGFYCDILNEWTSIKKNGYEQKQNEILLFNIGFTTRF